MTIGVLGAFSAIAKATGQERATVYWIIPPSEASTGTWTTDRPAPDADQAAPGIDQACPATDQDILVPGLT
jgi:hypothetical protein